jgi:hypothetical protein
MVWLTRRFFERAQRLVSVFRPGPHHVIAHQLRCLLADLQFPHVQPPLTLLLRCEGKPHTAPLTMQRANLSLWKRRSSLPRLIW